MKKRNSYIFYSIVLGLISVALFSCVLVSKDIAERTIFLGLGCISWFLFAVCAKTAQQTFYYNKAIDAWANWQEEMQKKEAMQIKKTEEVFEEFNIDYED